MCWMQIFQEDCPKVLTTLRQQEKYDDKNYESTRRESAYLTLHDSNYMHIFIRRVNRVLGKPNMGIKPHSGVNEAFQIFIRSVVRASEKVVELKLNKGKKRLHNGQRSARTGKVQDLSAVFISLWESSMRRNIDSKQKTSSLYQINIY